MTNTLSNVTSCSDNNDYSRTGIVNVDQDNDILPGKQGGGVGGPLTRYVHDWFGEGLEEKMISDIGLSKKVPRHGKREVNNQDTNDNTTNSSLPFWSSSAPSQSLSSTDSSQNRTLHPSSTAVPPLTIENKGHIRAVTTLWKKDLTRGQCVSPSPLQHVFETDEDGACVNNELFGNVDQNVNSVSNVTSTLNELVDIGSGAGINRTSYYMCSSSQTQGLQEHQFPKRTGPLNADVSTTNNSPPTAMTSCKVAVSSPRQDIKASLFQQSPNEPQEQEYQPGGILFRPEDRVIRPPVPGRFSRISHPSFLYQDNYPIRSQNQRQKGWTPFMTHDPMQILNRMRYQDQMPSPNWRYPHPWGYVTPPLLYPIPVTTIPKTNTRSANTNPNITTRIPDPHLHNTLFHHQRLQSHPSWMMMRMDHLCPRYQHLPSAMDAAWLAYARLIPHLSGTTTSPPAPAPPRHPPPPPPPLPLTSPLRTLPLTTNITVSSSDSTRQTLPTNPEVHSMSLQQELLEREQQEQECTKTQRYISGYPAQKINPKQSYPREQINRTDNKTNLERNPCYRAGFKEEIIKLKTPSPVPSPTASLISVGGSSINNSSSSSSGSDCDVTIESG